jgi:uncharacterized membrane protein
MQKEETDVSEFVVISYISKFTAEGARLQLLKMQREYLINPDDIGEKAWQQCEQQARSTPLSSPPGRGVRTTADNAQFVP